MPQGEATPPERAIPAAGTIRTPDQRLRVFVSSTLGELAAERHAARMSVQRLHLAPVMFELGARPHPPKALYRAYLSQSHVFVGIYWESYGWVAPEMAISGIEDEYELAAGKPCLVYVKEPSPGREPRLDAFLKRIKSEDRVSYKPFATAEQLEDLVADDLALLLVERFETAAAVPASTPVMGISLRSLPTPPTRLVGRDRDLAAVCDLVERDDVRLLTLSGVGGIGKSRLAMAMASRLGPRFADGAAFVDLSSVRSPELVPSAVAAGIGVPQEGSRPLGDLVVERLGTSSCLLVLDSFEHLVAAAPFVSRLMRECPGLKVVVTSRALLRLRGEHEFMVMPLDTGDVGGLVTADGAMATAAVRLFVERARDARPGFVLDDENANRVAELCSRLEGIPLAIELAAARVRVLPPQALLARIEDRLDLLTGPSDLPERQRTLRAAIDWSYDLLDEAEQVLFSRLSVFVGGFTLESAQEVCGGDGAPDILDGVSSLIEKSLVLPQDRPDVAPRFRMLDTVREYALGRLEQRDEAEAAKMRMARYLAGLGEEAATGLDTSEFAVWYARLDAELDNMRAAMTWALANARPDLFLRICVLPLGYWWEYGHIPELRQLFERCWAECLSPGPELHALQLRGLVLARTICGEGEASAGLARELLDLERSLGDAYGIALAQWQYCILSDAAPAILRPMLREAAETFRRLGAQWEASFSFTTLGALALLDGDVAEGEKWGEEGLVLGQATANDAAIGNGDVQLGHTALARGDLALARSRFEEGAAAFQRTHNREGVAYALDGLAAIAFAQGRPRVAAEAVGAADAARERIRVGVYPFLQRAFRGPLVSAIQVALGPAVFDEAHAAGGRADIDTAIKEMLRLTASPTAPSPAAMVTGPG